MIPQLKYPGVPHNFGGILTDASKAKIWCFGIPFDSTTSYRSGAKNGPLALRLASQQTETYDILTDANIFEDPGIYDLGDMDVVRGNVEKTVMRVAEEVENILQQKKISLILGGEHGLTAGAVKGASKIHKDLKVVCFDAHGDLRNEYEGDKFNHACGMRRSIEFIGGEKNLLEIGIREICEEEAQFGQRMIFSHEIRKNISEALDKVKKFVSNSNVYVSIDIDFMDLSIVPGTGTPQPNGLFYHEALEFIKQLKAAKKIVGMDLMELSPLPGSVASEAAATKFLFQSIAQLRKNF
jgi:agmatinase